MHSKLLTIVFVFLPMLAVAAPRKAEQSSLVRLHFAGGNLVDEASYTKYDPKSRYFLIATGDCDGASIDLILTPNPDKSGYAVGVSPQEMVARKYIKRVILPRLRNGSGVNIGDTPQQVERKLDSRPSQILIRKEINGREWVYLTTVSLKRKGSRSTLQNYRATYTFRNDKLWAIHYNLQEPDGCN